MFLLLLNYLLFHLQILLLLKFLNILFIMFITFSLIPNEDLTNNIPKYAPKMCRMQSMECKNALSLITFLFFAFGLNILP